MSGLSDWIPDGLVLLGLVLLGIGLALISVPVALVVVGCLLLIIGLAAARARTVDDDR